jgi:hypothetical protein
MNFFVAIYFWFGWFVGCTLIFCKYYHILLYYIIALFFLFTFGFLIKWLKTLVHRFDINTMCLCVCWFARTWLLVGRTKLWMIIFSTAGVARFIDFILEEMRIQTWRFWVVNRFIFRFFLVKLVIVEITFILRWFRKTIWHKSFYLLTTRIIILNSLFYNNTAVNRRAKVFWLFFKLINTWLTSLDFWRNL